MICMDSGPFCPFSKEPKNSVSVSKEEAMSSKRSLGPAETPAKSALGAFQTFFCNTFPALASQPTPILPLMNQPSYKVTLMVSP